MSTDRDSLAVLREAEPDPQRHLVIGIRSAWAHPTVLPEIHPAHVGPPHVPSGSIDRHHERIGLVQRRRHCLRAPAEDGPALHQRLIRLGRDGNLAWFTDGEESAIPARPRAVRYFHHDDRGPTVGFRNPVHPGLWFLDPDLPRRQHGERTGEDGGLCLHDRRPVSYDAPASRRRRFVVWQLVVHDEESRPADHGRRLRVRGPGAGVAGEEDPNRYVLRAASPPTVTSLALTIIASWQGAIITETVFNWPGLGRLFFEAITRLDAPVVIGLTAIYAYLLVGTVLILDLIY